MNKPIARTMAKVPHFQTVVYDPEQTFVLT
jgi:hypothetical protein